MEGMSAGSSEGNELELARPAYSATVCQRGEERWGSIARDGHSYTAVSGCRQMDNRLAQRMASQIRPRLTRSLARGGAEREKRGVDVQNHQMARPARVF